MINSVTVNWEVNGVAQSPFLLSGANLQPLQDTTVTLGNFMFLQSQCEKYGHRSRTASLIHLISNVTITLNGQFQL